MSIRSLPLLVLVFAYPVMASAACTNDAFPIALPIQRMDERLQDLAHKTGCFMEVDPSLLQDLKAPALSGKLTARQALTKSLKGSRLRYRFVKDHWRITLMRGADDHPIHDSFVQPW
ncbi:MULTISPECIES: STN domain-containing protein [unclassified Gluconobacter]|uniref:STN domain-containing protein n=1 Tax=unclassified Gluconobacter TaxID=2644261 RepID=UPI00207B9512|nr:MULTISPECIES: STN domain-containing protein [unclassified Gluconobacter]